MMNISKHFILPILASAILLFTSCAQGSPTQTADNDDNSEKRENAVITYKDTTISENEYVFLMSTYKAQLLSSLNMTVDNPEMWASEMAADVTFGDFYETLFLDNIMSRAIWLQLFDENGLSLSNEQEKSVDDLVDEWIRYCDGEANFNSVLETFGINAKLLKQIKLDDLKVTAIQEYLFGSDGTMRPTDEEIEDYYLKNYYRTKFIRLNKTRGYKFDENGEPVYNKEKGEYEMYDLTEGEITEREALYTELQAKLTAGEDFDSLLKNTMEPGMAEFEDGYYITESSTFVADEVKKAVKELEVGAWTAVETYGDWYIVKRYELTKKPYLNEQYLKSMFTTLADSTLELKKRTYISTVYEELECDVKAIKKAHPFEEITPNFNIQ